MQSSRWRSMASITVEVPEGVSSAQIRAALDRLASEAREKAKAKRAICDALDSEDGLKRWLSDYGIRDPVVRASAYAAREICIYQEIAGVCLASDRNACRPVIMRGSTYAMVRRFGLSSSLSANGFCERLVSRYIRRIKLTCLCREDWALISDGISQKVRTKFGVTGHFQTPSLGPVSRNGQIDGHWVFIGGRRVFLEPDQLAYITKLLWIIRKTDKAAERLAMLREYRCEQIKHREVA